MQYRPEIDGLRALAVIPVILFHAGFTLFGGGYVGVDVFFVISGYLITSIILNDLESDSFDIISFYERRCRRILPALYLITVTSLVLAWFLLLPFEMKSFAQSLVAVSTFSSNVLFWLQSGYFDGAAEQKPLLHTWSLAVEEQYYLLFPLVLLVVWRTGRIHVQTILVALLLLSFFFSQWAASHAPTANFYLLPSRAWELLIGVVLAFRNRTVHPPIHKHTCEFAGIVGLCLILAAVFQFDSNTPFPSAYALAPTIGAALVILFAIEGTVTNKILRTKSLIGIGLVSYSAYLWHQPLLAFAKYRSPTEPSTAQIVLICFLVLPVSYLSWRYVEVPFRRKGFIRTKTLAATFIATTVLLMGVGLAGHLSNGFEKQIANRYSGTIRKVATQFGESPAYVSKIWTSTLLFRDFDEAQDAIKVLIIGDSYGQDLANAIYEAGLSKKYFLSAYAISRRCGNIWTNQDLSPFIELADKPKCNSHKRYSDEWLQSMIKNADEVWLASSWQEWHVPFVPETVQRLREVTDARVRVFGRKNFGQNIKFYNYLVNTKQGTEPYVVKMSDEHLRVNRAMSRAMDSETFVDISKLICGTSVTCVNNTSTGLLISFDGGHLTEAGARHLGDLLHQNVLANSEANKI